MDHLGPSELQLESIIDVILIQFDEFQRVRPEKGPIRSKPGSLSSGFQLTERLFLCEHPSRCAERISFKLTFVQLFPLCDGERTPSLQKLFGD